MIRKVAYLLGLLSLALVVAACGGGGAGGGDQGNGGGNNTGGGNQGDQASGGSCEGPDGNYLIGMSQANNAEPYREVMNEDIRKAAEKVPQFEVSFADAAQDNAKQVSDVENFLTQQIDLLIISPNEAAPLTAVVQRVYEQGIPVIVLDRKVNGDAYTQFIGADNFEIGRQAGEYVAKELLPDGGRVVEITGLPGSTPAQERGNGFKEGISGNPDIKIIAKANGEWLREEGQAQFEAILQAQDQIDLVYSHNDPMAEGAYLAAQAVNRQDDMQFVGIDALPIPSGGIRAVQEGRLSATFVYPTGGREAIEAAKKLLIDCGDVEKERTLPTQLVTKENAKQVYSELGGQ
jgi:ribose transport system substrate-binding protein